MKWRFEWLYRLVLAGLFATALWSVWANAQETNSPPAAATATAGTNALTELLLPIEQHALTFRLDEVGVLRETKIFGVPAWKYLASLIYIVLAFYIAKLLDFIIGVWLKRWAAKTETKYDDLVLELLRGPVKVVAFVIFLHIGLSVFKWPDVAQKFLSRGLVVVVACSIAYVALKVVDLFISLWREKGFAKGTDSSFADQLLPLVRKVAKVTVIVSTVMLTANHLGIAAQIFLTHGLVLLVACSITYVALKAVDLVITLWRRKATLAQEDNSFVEQLLPLLSKVAKVTVVITAIMLTADNLGIKITSLLAGLSIGGLALGLAAQDTVANLFGAVAIFLDKPFRIGDMVKIEGVQGTVETIGLRSTRIRNLDGHLVAIPNKTMGNTIITNITRRPTIRTEMNFGLTCDTSVEKVKRATVILEEIFRAHPRTADLVISFNKFTDSTLNIFVAHVWDGTEVKAHFAALQELNLQIKQRFEAEGIEFAFPTQTVHLKQGA